jgi:alpha-glucoside transport system permease protein
MPTAREGIDMFANMRLTPGKTAIHLAVLFLVVLWTLPTLGILISSFRDKNLISSSGWWTATSTSERPQVLRLKGGKDAVEKDGKFVITGNILQESIDGAAGKVVSFGLGTSNPRATEAGATLTAPDGKTLVVNADGAYTYTSTIAFDERGQRVSVIAAVPPSFTTENYKTVLNAEGIGRSFLNSLTVAIPSTIIPILIAAFAAYALSWMDLPRRGFFVAVIVALLVVPLQLSLIPLLKIYNQTGAALGISPKGYLGIWLAHTGFGLPFAIYLFRSYIAGLPKDLIESARVDGANDFRIFMRIVLPLSFPVLASFAIFQFLWTWNDLLVAIVFLGTDSEQLVLTGRLNNLLGSRGGNWEILTTSAFITIVVPVLVFFSLQRYFVRGLLAGSVKGG